MLRFAHIPPFAVDHNLTPRQLKQQRALEENDVAENPYNRSYRPGCDHSTDDGDWHNYHESFDEETGQPHVRRTEATGFNATCGDDSDQLLRHCLPEVFVDHTAVTNHIAKERKYAMDPRFNLGKERRTRFVDYDYLERMNDIKRRSVKGWRPQQERATIEDGVPRPSSAYRIGQYVVGSDPRVETMSDVQGHAHKQNKYVDSPNLTARQPMASASADVFDVWPTIESEYPVMVRRPENSHLWG